MEDKNETDQNKNDAPQSSETKSSDASGAGMADKLIEDVKKFNLMSLIGLGLVLAFLLFMFINSLSYKWWIMLPLAGAAGFILYRQLSDTQGFEKKACFYALIVIGVLILFRDIQMSNNSDRMRVMSNAGAEVMAKSIKLMERLKAK